MVAGNSPSVLNKNDLTCLSSSGWRAGGGGQTLLSPKLVKHAVGYVGDISQVNTHSNTHTGRFQGNVKGERERETGERISVLM